ncbi:threonine-phosphate decarboxylase [Caldichromatium japonicum]|uniref:threonine-phosphate decarboxylase n=2 Tax=Caldichromatium japonicum TaxID=2699430 RepID=A0A6G7VGY3_9GAMM|nr:threonine-phosphate decarboxylase [Caldichromatium japonicum]
MELAPPEHGGGLRAWARRFGRPLGEWVDLSTGINPRGWSVPELPSEVWQRLPEEDDGLAAAAAAYYGTEGAVPVPGVQAAIQLLPYLRPPCRVGVPAIGYAEHAYRWRLAGHQIIELPEDEAEAALGNLDVLVVIHPNNPTGRRWPADHLLAWHEILGARGGWLVVDESFIDPTPEASLVQAANRPGLIILRSLGKFFGLGGARVGFVFTEERLAAQVRRLIGPWSVGHPARWVARLALLDHAWQARARVELAAASERLAGSLGEQGLAPAGGTALFQWILTPDAATIQRHLAEEGILVRRFAYPASLRFGLPADEAGWARLEKALVSLNLW